MRFHTLWRAHAQPYLTFQCSSFGFNFESSAVRAAQKENEYEWNDDEMWNEWLHTRQLLNSKWHFNRAAAVPANGGFLEKMCHTRELSAATATWRIGACNLFVPMCVTSPQHSTIIHKISGSPSFSNQQLLTHIFAWIFHVPILANRHRSRWVARLALAVLRLMNEWINIYGICPWNWK